MIFSSSAFTVGEFRRDFNNYSARKAVQMGLSPASSVMDTDYDLRSGVGKLKSTQGGAAYDRVDDGADQTYRARRNEFIMREEGNVPTAYKDPLGLTTVGVGFNMDQPRAREMFATALPGVDFDEVYSGKRPLAKEEAMRLLDYSASAAENIVGSKFKGVELSEHQRIALVSLAYNNPSFLGPKLTDAVKRGDADEVVHQLLYQSNRQKLGGIFSRRYREAAMFVGPAVASQKLPSFKDYMQTAADRYGSPRQTMVG